MWKKSRSYDNKSPRQGVFVSDHAGRVISKLAPRATYLFTPSSEEEGVGEEGGEERSEEGGEEGSEDSEEDVPLAQ